MTLTRLQLALILLGGLTAAAQQAPTRFPLTREAVAAALAATVPGISSADITLPAALTASVAAPRLTPASAQLAGPTQLRIRLNCATLAQCLPFFVTADLHTSAAALAAQQQLTPQISSARQAATTTTLRVGQHATLLLEDDHMRISLPVISIDAGAPGAEVRVASLDHKQTFRAVVRDANTVRGELP